MMAGALAVRLKANGVSAVVCAVVLAGFLMPVGFLAPDMRVFWLEEGSGALLAPAVAGLALVVLWSIVGCVSLERKELE
jgi:membrane protein CcdC involved in cytochrome C biogenesis